MGKSILRRAFASRFLSKDGESFYFPIKYKMMLLLFAVTFIVVVALTVVSLRIARHALMERAETHLVDKAEDMSEIVAARIHATMQYFHGVAKMPFLQDTAMTFAERSVELTKDIGRTNIPDLLFVSLVDTEGLLYHDGQPPVDLSEQPWFSAAMRGESYVTEPFKSVLDGKLIFVIAVPILGEGRGVIGVLNVALSAKWLIDQVQDIVVGKSGRVYIIDREGRSVADEEYELVLNSFSSIEAAKTNPAYQSSADFEAMAISNSKSGVGFYEWDRVEKMAGYSKIPITGWTIVAHAPIGDFLGSLADLQLMIALVGLAVLLIGLVFAYFASRRLVRPIVVMSEVLEAAASGDLSLRGDVHISSRDEIGTLAQSLSTMLGKLHHIIKEIRCDAAALAQASRELNGTSMQLSSSANEQAASTEEVSSTMEEIFAVLEQNTEQAEKTSLESMKLEVAILAVSEKSEEVIRSHYKISEKIATIRDIASQTNILALNAAVEAARAGEYGAGFSVVADEVRKLAERSKEAAEGIESLSVVTKVLAEEASVSLHSIVPDIENTAALVQSVTRASMEQRTGVDQVNDAILHLSHASQQNASISEELSATSEEMAAQAARLQEMLDFFKTR